MFKSKTVFVIGAGASAEANLPVGDKLAIEIARLVQVIWLDHAPNRYGDFTVRDAMRSHISSMNSNDETQYKDAARRIFRAMNLSRSIDEFASAHKEDLRVQTLAKLSIARSILLAERRSDLYCDADTGHENDYTKLTDKWYVRLFKTLVADVDKARWIFYSIT